MSDPGVELLNHIYSRMNIDAEWSLRGERDFTWWSGPLAQTLTAGPEVVCNGISCHRVEARSDLVSEFRLTAENVAFLEVLASNASLSGYVHSPEGAGCLQLACSVWVHDKNLNWLKQAFSIAVAQQAADAYLKSEALAQSTGARISTSAHPESGVREVYDEMLGIIEFVICPKGEEPSPWSLADFESLNESLGRPRGAFVDNSGISIEFPFGKTSAHLKITTNERHPQLGNGLLLRLMVPRQTPREMIFSPTVDLDSRELGCESIDYSFGSWCAPPERMLTHVTFLPNLLYSPGLLNMLAQAESQRAEWAACLLADGV